MYELLNLTAAVERAAEFDIIHYEAGYYPMSMAFTRLSPTPISQTIHHAPNPAEVALWKQYPDAPFVAISREQARLLDGLNVVDIVPHGIDTDRFTFSATPDDYLLFLGRFTPGKGPVQAIEVAKKAGLQIRLAAADEQYYREHVAPLVDGSRVVYVGEVDFDAKVRLYGGARALLYPVQAGEPFGLVLAEAMACGTPVAALDRGAVREVVDAGVTGGVFPDLDAMVDGLDAVMSLDRARVRARAVERFGVAPMVNGYVRAFRTIAASSRQR
jgi:glycosyltransferase involved in cell wall biosynthesis